MKKPTTYEQQLDNLRSRGLIINDKEFCLKTLRATNYYRLTAYLLPFRKADHTYFDGVTFERIWKIYEFDRELRVLLFSIIEEIELYLRAQISYYHAHTYGATGYLCPENYDGKHNHEKFMEIVSDSIYAHRNTPIVKHHNKEYGGIFPIWVIVEFLSTGAMSKFYADLQEKDRKNLSREMFGVHQDVLESWVRCLTDLRNICAHYSRLYYAIFTSHPAFPRKMGRVSDKRLFDQVVMLKLMYTNKSQWNARLIRKLECIINDYSAYIKLNHIGFPDNWKDVLENRIKIVSGTTE